MKLDIRAEIFGHSSELHVLTDLFLAEHYYSRTRIVFSSNIHILLSLQ